MRDSCCCTGKRSFEAGSECGAFEPDSEAGGSISVALLQRMLPDRTAFRAAWPWGVREDGVETDARARRDADVVDAVDAVADASCVEAMLPSGPTLGSDTTEAGLSCCSPC